MNISLYFRVLDEYKPSVSATYLCSFYDTNTLKWNESGCTIPKYNQPFDRYECSCNHLSTFALVWSPYITHAILPLKFNYLMALVYPNLMVKYDINNYIFHFSLCVFI